MQIYCKSSKACCEDTEYGEIQKSYNSKVHLNLKNKKQWTKLWKNERREKCYDIIMNIFIYNSLLILGHVSISQFMMLTVLTTFITQVLLWKY